MKYYIVFFDANWEIIRIDSFDEFDAFQHARRTAALRRDNLNAEDRGWVEFRTHSEVR